MECCERVTSVGNFVYRYVVVTIKRSCSEDVFVVKNVLDDEPVM